MQLKPNLFSFATSELSQDAFICWLLEWANPIYKDADPALHSTAIQFLKKVFSKHNKLFPSSIDQVDVSRQVEKLDVLVVINKKYAILIEDKTFTSDHSDQLLRYFEAIKTTYEEDNCLPIYYKIGNQSNYNTVHKANYQVLDRKDILEILTFGIEQETTSDIFMDYYHHLLGIDNSYNSFSDKELASWTWMGWQGFYTELRTRLGKGDWGYVSNGNGGFLGYWWNFHDLGDCKVYLQLEQISLEDNQYGRLCFKIDVDEPGHRSKKRNEWHRKIMSRAKEIGLDISKPSRFGNGQTMTFAILKNDFRVEKNGLVDFEETIKQLRLAERVLDEETLPVCN
jgi:hypothetical protein